MIIDKPLDCDGFAAKLADHLEGDAPDAVRAAMEAHAAGCADCRQLLDDIGDIRHEAAALPRLTPSRDLWAGIAERIDAPVIPLEKNRRTIATRRTWARPAIAAAALVVFTTGVTYYATMKWGKAESVASITTPPQQVAVAPVPAPDSVEPAASGTSTTRPATVASLPSGKASPAKASPRSAGSNRTSPFAVPADAAPAPTRLVSGEGVMRSTEPVYDHEIEKLRRIVKTRRSQLDPKTVTVLEQSIAVIDSAIAQSRAALAKDPASGFLATQLNHSLEKKVELLRTAAMLPART